MKKLITALFLVLATAVWAGDFEAGAAAYKKGDFKTAVRLFQKVAIKGYSSAQYNLALMYQKGEGVVQDYAEAARWFKLSAAQGDSSAQINLAVRYYYGEGVLQDYLQAHMWMNLAAVSGDKDAQKIRDAIAAKMTSQQIGKAQAMAQKCLASQYKYCD